MLDRCQRHGLSKRLPQNEYFQGYNVSLSQVSVKNSFALR